MWTGSVTGSQADSRQGIASQAPLARFSRPSFHAAEGTSDAIVTTLLGARAGCSSCSPRARVRKWDKTWPQPT
jgi:hypothetical protein